MKSIRTNYNKCESAYLTMKWCSSDLHKQLTQRWLSDRLPCKAYIYSNRKKDLGIALLSRMDIDPKCIQRKPWLIDFVIVAPTVRRTGIATSLLDHIRVSDEASAFCSSIESENAFLKSGYYDHGIYNHLRLMRTDKMI